MPGTTKCPDAEALKQFLHGDRSDDSSERLAEHLAECGRCAETLERLQAEDTVVVAIRTDVPGPDEGEAEVVAGLVRRLEANPPPAAARPDEFAFLAPPGAEGELGRLGGYRVLRLLGAGGMGLVFHAEDPQLRRAVALKVMRPALAASASARQRFLREAQTTAALAHDHVIAIYQVGEERGVPYLAMPLLQGEALSDRLLRQRRLPAAEVLRLGREVAEGLAAAHARGLIHRDIKS